MFWCLQWLVWFGSKQVENIPDVQGVHFLQHRIPTFLHKQSGCASLCWHLSLYETLLSCWVVFFSLFQLRFVKTSSLCAVQLFQSENLQRNSRVGAEQTCWTISVSSTLNVRICFHTIYWSPSTIGLLEGQTKQFYNPTIFHYFLALCRNRLIKKIISRHNLNCSPKELCLQALLH